MVIILIYVEQKNPLNKRPLTQRLAEQTHAQIAHVQHQRPRIDAARCAQLHGGQHDVLQLAGAHELAQRVQHGQRCGAAGQTDQNAIAVVQHAELIDGLRARAQE